MAAIIVDYDIYHLVHLQTQMYSPSWTCPLVELPSGLEEKERIVCSQLKRKTALMQREHFRWNGPEEIDKAALWRD